MGQKVNPHGARVGVIKGWDSRWFADKKEFAANLIEDENLRKFLKKKLYASGVSKIEIERKASMVTVYIHTAKPGALIGKGGAGIEVLKKEIADFLKKPSNVQIVEVKKPDMDAQLVAENIAAQLEKRISFRRAMKQAQQRAMKAGAKGIKTMVAAVWAALKSPAAKAIMTAAFRCRHCVRTLSTALQRLQQPTDASV